MEISLIRHGKSLWTEDISITSREFKNWIQKYDDNGVFEEETNCCFRTVFIVVIFCFFIELNGRIMKE